MDPIINNPAIPQWINLILVAALTFFLKRAFYHQDQLQKELDDFKRDTSERHGVLKDLVSQDINHIKIQMAILLDRDIPDKLETLGKQMAIFLDRDRQSRMQDYRIEDERHSLRKGDKL